MLDVVDTPDEAAAQERPPLIVRGPLQEFLDSQQLGEGEIVAEPIGEGHSNVTYLIVRGDERYVLRRPPRPPVPPSANDVLRESRLLGAPPRARRSRRRPTTCCASRACWSPSSRPTCPRRTCSPSARTKP